MQGRKLNQILENRILFLFLWNIDTSLYILSLFFNKVQRRKMKCTKIKLDHKQLGGDCLPYESPITFKHEDVAGPPRPWYFKLILSSCTFLQGTSLLHFNVTATFELDVPHILLNVTLLICTFELSCP